MTLGQIRAWVFVVAHSPLGVLWLLQAIVVIAGIVRGFSHPPELLAAAGALGTINGVTRIVARVKGLEPWPPSPRSLSATSTPVREIRE